MDGSSSREILMNRFLRAIRGRLFRWRGPGLRLRDALLWSTQLDLWLRYTHAREVLEGAPRDATILEVGLAWSGLELFLPRNRTRAPHLVQTDIRGRPLARRVGEARLLASATALPFVDEAFDFVVAMDVLEHIPRDQRPVLAEELRRVARLGVVAHMPLDDGKGSFQGAELDAEFQAWHEARFGRSDPNIAEHLREGHPTPEDLAVLFPRSVLTGTLSAVDWRWYTRVARRPLLAPLAGLLLYLRRVTPGPPFYAGLMVWRRSTPFEAPTGG